MKPSILPLKLVDFAVINSDFKFVSPQGDVNIKELDKSYLIDVDFASGIYENHVRVFVKASINKGNEQVPGYSIFAEGVAIFEKPDYDKMDDKTRMFYELSALSISIGCLRSIIATITSSAPFGKYILPALDAQDLLNQKIQIVQNIKKSRQKRTASHVKKQAIKK